MWPVQTMPSAPSQLVLVLWLVCWHIGKVHTPTCGWHVHVHAGKLTAVGPKDLPFSVVKEQTDVMQTIPGDLQQLKRVKILNFNENRITSVPPEVLIYCQALHTLLLHSNPISAQVSQLAPCSTHSLCCNVSPVLQRQYQVLRNY